jgi:hypothetical protein
LQFGERRRKTGEVSPLMVTVGGLRLRQAARYDGKTKHRGIRRIAADFLLNLIAYNLIRIPKLVAA